MSRGRLLCLDDVWAMSASRRRAAGPERRCLATASVARNGLRASNQPLVVCDCCQGLLHLRSMEATLQPALSPSLSAGFSALRPFYRQQLAGECGGPHGAR